VDLLVEAWEALGLVVDLLVVA
jgi:hypothetical protein